MNIPLLGELKPHPDDEPDWLMLISEPIAVPYFDNAEIEFVLEGLEAKDEPAINAALGAFLRLTTQDRLAASKYVFQNYLLVTEQIDENGEPIEYEEDDEDADDNEDEIKSPEDVWDQVEPIEIIICRRRKEDPNIYIRILAGCDWDDEHGLQIIYRNGATLSRVSEQDGHLTHAGAHGLPESEDRIS